MKENIAIGIDIGGTNTSFGFVNKKGEVYFQKSISTQSYINFNDFINKLNTEIENGQKIISETKNIKLIGIGIGAPNSNYYTGNIENAPNLPWKGKIELVNIIKKYYKVPTFLTNDANAAAMGEMVFGGAKNMKNFVVVTLGTGLGCGIVANGSLVNGHRGAAGEMGHLIVKENGRACNCGNNGCLETYVSATGIVRTVRKLLGKQHNTSKLEQIPANGIDAKKISELANNGDNIAIEAFEQTGEKLGKALAKVVTITDPEAVFLFGGLAKAGNLIFEPTRLYFNKNVMNVFKNNIPILPSELNQNAAILGAAAMVF